MRTPANCSTNMINPTTIAKLGLAIIISVPELVGFQFVSCYILLDVKIIATFSPYVMPSLDTVTFATKSI